ncbi:MAG: assimilatory sulfite reductase (NADPH) hemoprotein subunit [Bacteroidales bacterium]|nr:assimilatory sulfite reductase (NADPH) hemoprotein subunit [Bacteroidales bacterium]
MTQSENKNSSATNSKLSEVEKIKNSSRYLRGTLKESLDDELTGSLAEADTQLIKFHGAYQQQDRELDSERKRQKLEPLYSFMIRVRVPGGIITPQQWLKLDQIADTYASGTLKLTTRQAVQFHGIFKKKLKKTIQAINDTLLDTIAACGDVNRNVMCSVNPGQSLVFDEVQAFAKELNDYFTPQTSAYHEIWLNKKLVAGGEPVEDFEPIYGKTYLPRKFKTAIAVPPYNDTDVFTNDLGFIAIEEDGKLIGYNVTAGGGLGTTFGMPETYPRLADLVGFVTPERALKLAEAIVLFQKDNGNRENRKIARLKYTIDRLGFDFFIKDIYKRAGFEPEPSKPFAFESTGDRYGWERAADGLWYLGLFVEGGRLKDFENLKYRTVLKEIAQIHTGDFRVTANQNIIVAKVTDNKKIELDSILQKYGILEYIKKSGLRRNSVACVALNTCTLAFAEAERYLPSLIDKLEIILAENGLANEDITIRMTGCPNGCGRPWIAEIGFIGKAPGLYNLYLGGGFTGNRFNTLYREMLNEEQIIAELTPIIFSYAQNRNNAERFGDFVVRNGYVKPGPTVLPDYRKLNMNFQI